MSEPVNPYQTPEAIPNQQVNGLLNTRVISRLCRVFLICVIVSAVYTMIMYFQMSTEFEETGMLLSWDGAKMNRVALAETIYESSYWVAVICVAFWTYRAMNNAWVLKKLKMNPSITRCWAVGYYCIPFINLWKPYEAMTEIEIHTSGSFQKKALYRCWWVFWILSNLLVRADRVIDKDDVVGLLNIGMFSLLSIILAAGCLERIIARINNAQMVELAAGKYTKKKLC